VSVVIAAGAPSAALDRCLAHVEPQVQRPAAELIVVLNCSPDAVPPDAAAALRARVSQLLFEPRVGKSHALNTGVAASRAEVIAFTDDDTLPGPDWLRSLTEPLLAPERSPAVVGCGGSVVAVYPAAGIPDWYRDMILSRPAHFVGPRHEPPGPFPEYVRDSTRALAPVGANCAYRREVFEKVRFDPELGPNRETGLRGGEDTLLAWQLVQSGLRILHRPEAQVLHPVPAQRLTVTHVLAGYFYQGIEAVRLRRALEARETSLADTRRRLRRLRVRVLLRALAPGRSRLVKAACRYEYRRGIEAEIEGSFRRGTTRPLDSLPARLVRKRFEET
jgi:glycosyltransferase involved in cell wall biosynthesis